MKKLLVLGGLLLLSVAPAFSYTTGPATLDASQVTTSGVPVVAVTGNTAPNGCWIQNDPNSTTNLVVDPVHAANAASPSSTASFVTPGSKWNCPGNSASNVTVDAPDSGHKFYGVKY